MWFKALCDVAATLGESASTEARCSELVRHVPRSFKLGELVAAVAETLGKAESTVEKAGEVRHQLLAALTCLRCRDRIREEPGDETRTQELAGIIARAIAPVVSPRSLNNENADLPAAFDDDLKEARNRRVEYCREGSTLGLQIFDAVMNQAGQPALDDDILLTLLAFTDETQEWSTADTAKTASALISQYFDTGSATKEHFITERALQHYLRPLFSKSKPSSVTASGRKAEYADTNARGHGIPDDSAQTKPWKYTDLRAIPVVAWAVNEADDQLIAQHWPLFIPVLLTLVDDSTTPIRRRGLQIAAEFLAKLPDKILQNSGLAKVFEDPIFPTLAYLPSLTPVDESVQLLVPAYNALLVLANKQPAAGKDGVPNGPKNSLLDKILREGVFMAYFHAKDHIRIVEVLCQQTAAILSQMGIHAVKHLKDLIPMLSTIMTDPFASAAPATLLSAIKTLQTVLANCWPRIPGSLWQDEIINALVLCWLHLAGQDDSIPDTEGFRSLLEQELLSSSKALAAVLRTGSIDLAEHVAPLVSKEPALARLFSS
ncbi:hypothetical protein MFIFM68171_09253 [Madurella fahalii]|uniref:Uncharacterized protein n=1 Tax=Madurella fahalii TaxID=1157608 RepID=A0ABQ0GMP7_9PEZI